MRARDYDNAMTTLRALVIAHRIDGQPLSMLKVYSAARQIGTGRYKAIDLAVTFRLSSERLVEVGLAIVVPSDLRHDRAFSPSPIGILVTTQHPELFPQPQATRDPAQDAETAPRQAEPEGGDHWRSVLAGFGIGLAILSLVMSLVGAKVLGGWLLCFSCVLIVLYFVLPTRWFRLMR
jgi:hypothetical protein